MVTPADLRRMLAKLADNHAQNQSAPQITPLDLSKIHSKKSLESNEEKSQIFVDIPIFSELEQESQEVVENEDVLQKLQ